MRRWKRPGHGRVAEILGNLDAEFLLRANCYFGGGTQIVLANGEYRESRDVDFICSSRDGFRILREAVREDTLGRIFRREIVLARGVRADRDGIRTFIAGDPPVPPVKFEILLEARIDAAGSMDVDLGVPALNPESAVAEKLLANVDRGLDESVHSRDLVDLAFLARAHGAGTLRAGLSKAQAAYGTAVLDYLERTVRRLHEDRAWFRMCVNDLLVDDEKGLRQGLRALRSFLHAAKEKNPTVSLKPGRPAGKR
jgi:hypothetical protein